MKAVIVPFRIVKLAGSKKIFESSKQSRAFAVARILSITEEYGVKTGILGEKMLPDKNNSYTNSYLLLSWYS